MPLSVVSVFVFGASVFIALLWIFFCYVRCRPLVWSPFSRRLLKDGSLYALTWKDGKAVGLKLRVEENQIYVMDRFDLEPLDYIQADGTFAQNQLLWDGLDTITFRDATYSVSEIFPFNTLNYDAGAGALVFGDKTACGSSEGVVALTPARLSLLLRQLYKTTSTPFNAADNTTEHPTFAISCTDGVASLVHKDASVVKNGALDRFRHLVTTNRRVAESRRFVEKANSA